MIGRSFPWVYLTRSPLGDGTTDDMPDFTEETFRLLPLSAKEAEQKIPTQSHVATILDDVK